MAQGSPPAKGLHTRLRAVESWVVMVIWVLRFLSPGQRPARIRGAAVYRRKMGNPEKAGPWRGWFIVPGILMVAALVLVGLGLSSFLHFVRADFVAYQPGTSISARSSGFTLWAEQGAAEPGDLHCGAARAGRVVQLRTVARRNTLRYGQGSFVAMASTPQDFMAGRYIISCTTRSGVTVPVFVGPRLDLRAVAILVVFNVITPLFLGVCSVLLLGILLVLRHRSHRKPSPPFAPEASKRTANPPRAPA